MRGLTEPEDMKTRRVASAFLGTWLLTVHVVPAPLGAQAIGSWRTFDVETREVTAPDLAIAPDGRWLVFSMLGHLFRLPVEGGQAEQLTFGPSYNARPAARQLGVVPPSTFGIVRVVKLTLPGSSLSGE